MHLLMEHKDNLSAGDVHSIMSAISMYMIRGNVLSDGLEDVVVVTLINWGYPDLWKDSTGVYVMLRKREKSFVVNHPGFTTISTTTFVDVLAKSFQKCSKLLAKNNEKEKCQEIP